MKILFITNRFPPIVDGVGDYTYNLAKEFVRNGHEVVVVCSKNSRVVEGNHDSMCVYPIVINWDRNAGKKIVCIAKQHNIDIVSLQYVPHGFDKKGLPIGLLFAIREIKKAGFQLFTFCHEVSVEYFPGTIKQRLLEFLMKKITRSLLKQSDYIATSITHYRYMIGQLVGKRNIGQIPIASNIPANVPNDALMYSLRNGIACADELVISFFGIRNVSTTLEAIKQLQSDGYKLKILFIGKIPDSIQNILPSNSIKTGVLDTMDIYKYFLVSDIMILPESSLSGVSFKSGSLAAAMEAGLPVITAKGYLTDDSMKDGENVVFVYFENISAVKRAIADLVDNQEKRKTIGEAANQLMKGRTWDYTYKEYMKIMGNYDSRL